MSSTFAIVLAVLSLGSCAIRCAKNYASAKSACSAGKSLTIKTDNFPAETL
jgi:hypothetical protein